MATVAFDAKSTQLVGLDSAPPKNLDEGPIMGGKVRIKVAEYTATALVAGKRIELARLPKGCRILPESCVITEDFAASTTMAIGYNQTVGALSSDTQFAAQTAVTTAGTKIPFVSTMLGEKLAEDTSIHILTAGATLTANKKLKLFLYYVPVID
jgi:hypothetical protein